METSSISVVWFFSCSPLVWGSGAYQERTSPFTGEPLGSLNQRWTAAAALEWICR